MDEILHFGQIFLVVAAAFWAAIATSTVSDRLRVPAPGLFLLGAAIASDVFPGLERLLSIRNVERIGVVALVVILFDGGMHVGRRRFRASAVPITTLGLIGTFATAGLMTVAAHEFLGFSWTTASLIGAALAPTDPAVMFSVLGKREVGGRTGTILEGESGANDPVGITLMIGMLELATHPHASFWIVVREFAVELAVGLAIGIAGAFMLVRLMRRPLPNEGLYALRALAVAGVVYGVATVAHGSGFLAVFVTGLLVGDERVPYKGEIERFHSSLASLAEIVVFVALGLTVHLAGLGRGRLWLDGLLLALILTFVVRPLVVWPLLLPTRLRTGERIFVAWGGLKGAVPILLTTLAVLAQVHDAARLYGIVFVVVAFSVVVQGTSIPFVASRLGVRMRVAEPEPWDLAIRLRREPRGVRRFRVAPGSRAAGEAIRDLPLGESAWIGLVLREGSLEQARGSFVLAPGDEALVMAEDEDVHALERLFEEGRAP